MKSKSKPLEPTGKIIPFRKPIRKITTPTLTDLPKIIFDQISKEYPVLTEQEMPLLWPMISIYRHPGLGNLNIPYQATLRQLAIRSIKAPVWICFCKGFATHSFCLCIGQRRSEIKSPNSTFIPRPVMIIEAGHPIPMGKGSSILQETADYRIRRFQEKSAQFALIRKRITALFRQEFERLPRVEKENTMEILFSG